MRPKCGAAALVMLLALACTQRNAAAEPSGGSSGEAPAAAGGGATAGLPNLLGGAVKEPAPATPGIAVRGSEVGPAALTRPWMDTKKPIAERVELLLKKMTSSQKVKQLESTPASAVTDLGISEFNYQRECLHGMVGENGEGVMYPQPIAWGATFDSALTKLAASQIGDEMRAFSNRQMQSGRGPAFTHCFGPHPAIVRDPRWGRLSETYGEDPLLSASMAESFVKGLQGGDGNGTYLKVSATCKHAIGNDLDSWKGITRYNFNAKISDDDMRDTFLRPFEGCLRANVASLMCSYNMVNGYPACASKELLDGIFRQQLGFSGFVSTDCAAIEGYSTPRPEGMGYGGLRQVSAQAMKAGSDLACQNWDGFNPADVSSDVLTEAARRVLTNRFRLGHFDPPNKQPFNPPASVIGSAAHIATARKLSRESIVLLKNRNGQLPLNPSKLKKVAVIGPWADNGVYLLGNYYEIPARNLVTPLQAIRSRLRGKSVTFNSKTTAGYTQANVKADAKSCQAADVCILFLGSRMHKYMNHRDDDRPPNAYDPIWEGETHDRETLKLNSNQEKMWKYIAGHTTKPIVVVLIHGGGLDISDMMSSSRIAAVMTAWFPGQGAAAIPDILFGDYAPSGRLPITWYKESYTSLTMTDMRMRASGSYPGRTYRYWKGSSPLFPFGYGLSYSSWRLEGAQLQARHRRQPGASASVTLRNTGKVSSPHVVLVFMSYKGAGTTRGLVLSGTGCSKSGRTDLVQSLVGFRRVRALPPGDSTRLTFTLPLAEGSESAWAGFGDPKPPCGVYKLRFGADNPAEALLTLTA